MFFYKKNGLIELTELNEHKSTKTKPKGLETISEGRKAFQDKDEEVQRQIVRREEKLQSLKEKSAKKDTELSEKELELKKLREKTRLMMQRAKEKEENFNQNEKALKTTLSQKEKKSRMDIILAKANEKANAMKEEMKAKRKKDEGEDDNLLAFLRKSHKKGENIYNYIDTTEEKENILLNPSVATSIDENPKQIPRQCTGTVPSLKPMNYDHVFKNTKVTNENDSILENVNEYLLPKMNENFNGIENISVDHLSSNIDKTKLQYDKENDEGLYFNKSPDISKPKEKLSTINFFLPSSSPKNPPKNDWNDVVETSIQNIENNMRNYESYESDYTDIEDNISSEIVHYAERWSLSPSKHQSSNSPCENIREDTHKKVFF